jgi:hypothetical protein
MSQQKKPREFWIEVKSFSSNILAAYYEKPDELTYRIAKDVIHVVEKSAYDRVVEALKFYADKSNHTVRRGGESDTRVRLDKGSSAREALKEVGEL